MDDLEKVETIRTKCNVSYTDAKAALDAADGNVLDAIIWLESQGKTQTTSAHAATESAPADEPSAEMVAAQAAYEKSSEKTDFSKKMDSVWEYLKKLFRLSLDTKFIATRRDAIILNIPILIPIVALFAWGATIWLMLLGLFFGMRYRIDSDGDVPGSINNLMDQRCQCRGRHQAKSERRQVIADGGTHGTDLDRRGRGENRPLCDARAGARGLPGGTRRRRPHRRGPGTGARLRS